MITTEGIKYRFKSTTEELHVFTIHPKLEKCVFEKKVVDNLTDSGDDMYYVGYRDNTNLAGVQEQKDLNLIGVFNEELLIKTIEESRKKFSKRDQIKADSVTRFQYVAGFPANSTIIHSVNTNSIKNNPIT